VFRRSRYYTLFFLSGFAALLYQIVWQRALFTFYGVNIESVTVIVTAFMIGLGFGSLAGGRLSTIRGLPLLGVFGAIECGIGLFGFFSLTLFARVASWTAASSTVVVGSTTLGLLLAPTLLMGATLPLLAAHFVRETDNVGESVGILYCVNTCGSALACVAAAVFLMRELGEAGTVRVAVAVNALVGLSGLLLQRAERSTPVPPPPAAPSARSGVVISFPIGFALAAILGFIALAYEIIWYRLFAFASIDAAPSFAWLLGAYLFGIALGSLGIRDFARQKLHARPGLAPGLLANLVVWAGVTSFLVGPLLARTVHAFGYHRALALVVLATALLGGSFPLLAHSMIASADDAGEKVSYVYIANIVGSAGGSFVVGYILMDWLSVQALSACLLIASIGVAAYLLSRGATYRRRSAIAGLVVAAALAARSPVLYDNLYARLLAMQAGIRVDAFRHVVETRSGVITVTDGGAIFGGGVYDGRFNTDPVNDTNGIYRVYALSAIPRPAAEVLVVGLASGSWAQVLANRPDVAHVTIVEINPGYLKLIPQYPQVGSLLANPKVTVVVDDGRRWLLRHPERKFDLSVMNVSVHGRVHSTHVLSVEFLELVRQHLNPGGIHFFNTTWSPESLHTGVTTFKYGLRIFNFLAVSDTPILPDAHLLEERLHAFTIDGRPVFDERSEVHRKALEKIVAMVHSADATDGSDRLNESWETGERLRQRLAGVGVITDDNMGSEWR